MKNNLSTFQMVLYGFLILVIIAGVLVFSMQRSQSGSETVSVTAWGTISESVIRSVVDEINAIERDTITLDYREFSAASFESELVDALAAGRGPDIVFMDDDLIIKHENKLYNINYDSYPQKTFRDNFIEAGDVLTTDTGIIGLPYIVDPLVLYWNRSMLNSAGISMAPAFWEQLFNMTPRIASIDSDLTVQKASIALGQFRNIRHAKDIIASLIMQSGNPIVSRNTNPNVPNSFIAQLNESFDFPTKPVNAALNFYTQFSNPSLSSYTWNRSLPNSDEMFLSGDLAFYIGYASEYQEIQRRNPNLNFDVAMIPQSRISVSESGRIGRRTLGKLTFVGIVNNTNNLQSAFSAVSLLTNRQNINVLSEIINLPPVRRDLLASQSDNAILQTFYESALIAKPFIDPDPNVTNDIFLDMIESYTSGRSSLNEVVNRADDQLKRLIR